MASQFAKQDQNSVLGLIAHSGTADNAETVRLVSTAAGALTVDIVSGDTINIGTVNVGSVAITSGTFNVGTVSVLGTPTVGLNGTSPVRIIDGTVTEVSKLSLGTVTRVEGGTISTNMLSGTMNLGTVTGNVGISSGTITTLPNLPGGSVVVTVGTISTLPNIPGGSIVVTIGTVGAGTINSVANLAAGTVTRVEGGTLGLITRVGNLGTLEVGTISTLPNIPGGTIGVVTSITGIASGTINNSGTTTGVGVVSMLSAGTLTTIPNIPGGTVGVVSSLTNGSIIVTLGTIGGGNIADDGITPGNPVMVGGYAISPDGTDPGNVSAEADVTRFRTDLNRRLLVSAEHPRAFSYHENSSNALTDASVVADPGDGFQIVITDIICSTGAATALNIFFEEGATTILGPYYLEATAGRGFALHFTTGKRVTASTALTVTTSAAIAHSVDVLGYIQAV